MARIYCALTHYTLKIFPFIKIFFWIPLISSSPPALALSTLSWSKEQLHSSERRDRCQPRRLCSDHISCLSYLVSTSNIANPKPKNIYASDHDHNNEDYNFVSDICYCNLILHLHLFCNAGSRDRNHREVRATL